MNNLISANNLEKNNFIHLDLESFKTLYCPKANTDHNKKLCFDYHQYYDKRRDIKKINYHNKLCGDNKINCLNNSNCKKCHNKIELFYHPKNYKTKYCIEYLTKNGQCEFKNYCSFAHSKKELKINILENYKFNYNFFVFKYKTEFCPLMNFEHDKNNCIYAHSIHDFRRNNMIDLIPKSCKNWKMNEKKKLEDYKMNCPNGYECRFCHGFKEYDYHPLIFKTKPCYSGKNKCKFGAICHFFHNEKEKREIKDIVHGLTYSCKKIKMQEKDWNEKKIKKKFNPKIKEFVVNNDSNKIESKKSIKDLLKIKYKKIKQMSTQDIFIEKKEFSNNNL